MKKACLNRRSAWSSLRRLLNVNDCASQTPCSRPSHLILFKQAWKVGVLFIFVLSLCISRISLAAASTVQTKQPQQSAAFKTYPRAANEFEAAMVVDTASGMVLYEYEADKVWSAASLTKLMGALVFTKHHPAWSKIVSLSSKDEVGGGRLRVNPGAKVSVQDLLYSSITASANNAAMALARISGLGMPAFIQAMNRYAADLHLVHTHFVDASGMDPKNVTTARDMTKLASAAFNDAMIRRAATTGKYRFVIRNTGQVKEIRNTNALLTSAEYEDFYVTGGKTGFLYESKHNLAVRVRSQDDAASKRMLTIVIFGAPDTATMFKSGASLAKWAWTGYTWGPI